MHPHPVFGIDQFLIVLSIICVFGTVLFLYLIRSAGYSIKQLLLLQLSIVFSALLGAKVFSLYVRDWQLYLPLKHEITAGWRYPGAVIGLLVLLPLFKRMLVPQVSLLRCADASVIASAFAMGVVRVSCFLNGCCTGAVGHAPYCWSYARGSAAWFWQLHAQLIPPTDERSLPVVPLHLYFMIASLAVGVFLLKYRRYQRFDGELVLWFLLLHEGAKAALETFRMPYIRELQITSAAIALLAGVALIVCHVIHQRGTHNSIKAIEV